jgi:hypothetical protein
VLLAVDRQGYLRHRAPFRGFAVDASERQGRSADARPLPLDVP